MNATTRLIDLLVQAKQWHDQGKPFSVQDLCPDRPDLWPTLAGLLEGLGRHQQPLAGDTPTTPPATPNPATPGPVLPGYELLEEIARGGMGVVYRARQLSLNRVVALKMIRSQALASEAEVRRFQAEAELAAGLDHPNLVPIYEVGRHDDQHFFSMKLIEGASLAHFRKDAPADRTYQRRVARIVAVVARAVHHAHQRGLLHRDLKPGNVMLDREGQPHVTDFGLAKHVEGDSGLTQPGAIVGTPSYMAPEQARATRTLTTAADVYGLGAILYELLTGRPPFRGPSVLDTLQQVLSQEPVPPRALDTGISRDLETVTLKCLQKDPPRRYSSAEALAEDLERWLAGEPIRARAAGRLERLAKWARRRPAAAALVVVITLAVAALGGIGVYYNGRLREQLQRAQDAEHAARDARGVAEERGDRLQGELGLSRRLRYNTQLTRAADLAKTEPALARRLLEDELACPPAVRDFSWSYFYGLCRREPRGLGGQPGAVPTLAWSADGRAVFSGSAGTVDLKTAQPIPGTLVQWDPATATRVHVVTPQGGMQPWTLVVAPDGKTGVAPGERDGPALWDLASGRKLRTLQGRGEGVRRLAWSGDGRIIAGGARDGTVRTWDAGSGLQRPFLGKHKGNVLALALSGNGRLLATTSGNALFDPMKFTELKVWDVLANRELASLDVPPAPIFAVAFSRDARLLAAGIDNDIHLWEVSALAPPKRLRVLHGHTGDIRALSFAPDGRTLASGALDRTARLWDVPDGRLLTSLRDRLGSVLAVAFSPDGRTVAVGGDPIRDLPPVVLWEVVRSQTRLTLGHPAGETFRHLAVGAGGCTLVGSVSDGSQVVLWEARTGKQLTILPSTTTVFCLALSPEGKTLAVGEEEPVRPGVVRGLIRLWDVPGCRVRTLLRGHDGSIFGLAFSPDGKLLASGASDGSLKLWDHAAGRETARLGSHATTLRSLVFSADGRTLVSGSGNDSRASEITLHDVATGTERLRITDREGILWDVAITPDGKTVISTSGQVQQAGKVKLWDGATGRLRAVLEGHTGDVLSLAVTPDGQTLASGSSDRTVRLWDPLTGQERGVLRGLGGPVSAVAFAADGKVLATLDGTIKLWDGSSGR
jgi:WD40 repeat protein/tRNA A-37 threonylcarbamoyl transferase component Bud32